ncbi:pyrimidine 5'-nucleotidase [Legionella cardiaca]|uniref:Pyrimidine 5'-nucleotidase n=1 Tax=Legionella cardiaca TaxID=1071983 RepID=A0ABY8AN23_9GAMM|nr:pyrimidine 5'-nucleotidase [Legionella cardiaca]WED42047.1 pyrimidine 5'-nucleotidase [Legionella cardiaca]
MGQVKNYEWILFDADETLFSFDAFSGLQRLFLDFGINFTQQDFQEYQLVNKSLWVDYQNGAITAQQLQHLRFNKWANKLEISSKELSRAFLATMAEICTPLEGAVNLLATLQGRVKLGIITNGFIELQQVRLERTKLGGYFDLLVISEEVGVAKPDPAIFNYALSKMGNPAPERVLMVGDNPDSDILGGMNAGLDTCWFNADKKPIPSGLNPQYQISSLLELEGLLLNKTTVKPSYS